MDEVGRIGWTLRVVSLRGHPVGDVFVEHDAMRGRVAFGAREGVEEIGVVGVRLVLADEAEKLVEAASVRQAVRTFVAPCPFAEKPRGIARTMENFAQDGAIGEIRLLSRPAVGHFAVAAIETVDKMPPPVFAIAAHVSVARVLSRHQASTRWGRHGTPRVGLCEAYALSGEAINVGRSNVLLAVAGEVAIAEVVAKDNENIGPLLRLHAGQCGEGGSEGEGSSFHNGQIYGFLPIYGLCSACYNWQVGAES